MEPNASDLVGSALRGSREAWEALVDLHGHAVLRSLVALGLTPDRARDIAQNAWMRLIEQQRAGKLESMSLPGLAIAQAGFLAREELRKSRPAEVALEEAKGDSDGAANPETRAARREQVEHAQRVLSGSSRSAQEVFRLAYGGEGLSHARVAARVGISVQRVRQILCEVRKELRAALEESDHG